MHRAIDTGNIDSQATMHRISMEFFIFTEQQLCTIIIQTLFVIVIAKNVSARNYFRIIDSEASE